MRQIVKMKWLLLAFTVMVSVSCNKDGGSSNEGPKSLPVNTIKIFNESYSLNGGSYFSGMYSYIGMECTNFYLACSTGAGITIEVNENLVGKTIPFTAGDDYWFFAIGTGNGFFVALQNEQEKVPENWYNPNDKYSGWFRIERDTNTNKCALLFSIDRNGISGWAMGNIDDTFVRLTSL